MANTELNNPFDRMGTHVYGERFVGRSEYVRKIRQNCTSRNFSIQGLPKIGKTSLAFQSVITGKDLIKSDKPLVTIFFTSIGTSENSHSVFKSLARVVYQQALTTLDDDAEKSRLKEHYQMLKDDDFDGNAVQDFFQYGVSQLKINFVIIFDEFDKVRKIGFHGPQFALLRVILSLPNVHGIITSKRSIRTLERWCEDSEGGPSNLYSLFLGDNTIHLQPFDDDSMAEYWKRLQPYYEAIDLALDDNYKKQAIFYAGHHPHMLDVYNSHIYEHWQQKHEMPDDLSLRTVMEEVFESNEDVLKNEGLQDTAIKVVIGPVYDLKKNCLDRLEEYGFIRPTTREKKFELMGVDMGFVAIDDDKEKAFLCPSDYYTLLMKSHYVTNAPFWDEWKATLSALRLLAQKYLIDKYGQNWEDSTESDFITEMRELREKDVMCNIPVSPMIDYLVESKLKKLIDQNWQDFSKVFSPITLSDFKRKLNFIIMIRNHHAHTSELHISDENKEKANTDLNEIKNKIDDWMAQHKDESLVSHESDSSIVPESSATAEATTNDAVIRTCHGKYVARINKVKDNWTGYSCEVRSKTDDDLYDDADIEYELCYEMKTKPDGSEKKYYYAINVRLKS